MTYSANARLQKPATSDRNWDVPINANTDALDAMTAIGALATAAAESPSLTLNVAVAAGNFRKSDGTIGTFAGASPAAVPASSTTCLWLDDSATLRSGPAFPATAHLRLARAVAGASTILRVVDERVQCSAAGSGLGFVLKAGDAMIGPLTIAGTSGPILAADPIAGKLGFFGSPAASQAPALAPLSAPAGSASDALADVGPSYSQATLNNNFAGVAAKVDALIAAMKRHGLMGS